jgi:hypothetical protein
VKSLSVSDFKAHLSAYLRNVQRGESYLITEHRRPVAEVRQNDSGVRLVDYPSEPYPVLIRSPDAIHLASAEQWLNAEFPAGEPGRVSIWSLDSRMNQCAALLGFETPCS